MVPKIGVRPRLEHLVAIRLPHLLKLAQRSALFVDIGLIVGLSIVLLLLFLIYNVIQLLNVFLHLHV